jgi:hypothetical protein
MLKRGKDGDESKGKGGKKGGASEDKEQCKATGTKQIVRHSEAVFEGAIVFIMLFRGKGKR